MSDPWPPAFIRTAPPTEPGTPTAHSRPVSPAATVRRARVGRATAPPARTSVPSTRQRPKPGPRWTTTPANPASATSRLEPFPSTSTAGRGRRRAPATAHEPVLVLRLDGEGGGAADPVGGAAPERSVQHGPVAQAPSARVRRHPRRPRRRVGAVAAGRHQLVGERGQVAGPQGQAQVAGPQQRRRPPPQVVQARARSAAPLRGGAARTASATRRPDTPGTGASPAL